MNEDHLDMIILPGPTTPEGAALTLLQIIANCEGKRFNHLRTQSGDLVDRQWVFDTSRHV